MNNTLTIRSHDELIAYVPHLLGFQRIESSMVCLAIGGGPTARLDLPDSPEAMRQFLDQMSDVYLRRHPTRRVALIAFGEDGRACIEALSALGETLVDSDRGPDVGPMLWVNGEEVSGGTGCKPAAGYLCLESEGAPVEFRDLRIRELP